MDEDAERDDEVEWNSTLTDLCKDEGEKSLCLQVLHSKAEAFFCVCNNIIQIPILIINTSMGSLNVGSQSIFAEPQQANIIIGYVIIVGSLISAISAYFGFAKRAEAHRTTALGYGRVYNLINQELHLPYSERVECRTFLKTIRSEIQRLNEASPQIPDRISNWFRTQYKDATLSKPWNANGLDPIVVYVPPLKRLIRRTASVETGANTAVAIAEESPVLRPSIA